MLLQRDVPAAAKFYSEGLGLPVRVLTQRYAELGKPERTVPLLALKAVDGCEDIFIIDFRRICLLICKPPLTGLACSEAFLSTGFSPFLAFSVPDLQHSLQQMLQLGGRMDGAIIHAASGKVCTLPHAAPRTHCMQQDSGAACRWLLSVRLMGTCSR